MFEKSPLPINSALSLRGWGVTLMRRIVGADSFITPHPNQNLKTKNLPGHHFHTLPTCHLIFQAAKSEPIIVIASHKMLKTQLHFLSTLFLMHFLLAHLGICEGVSVIDLNSMKMKSSELEKRVCVGKVGECLEMAAEEEMMDSESNRRALLMRRRYISYDTLRRDLVPCDRPGASYYNCKGPGIVNSYGRGCEIITRCARGD